MQHAWMRFDVIAETEADFAAWLARQIAAPPPPSGDGVEGARVFGEKKCGDCHAVSPADTRALIGPPLTHLVSRRLLGGEIPNSSENRTRWTVAPQSIKPGNRMADPRLSAAEVRVLSAYLESLR